jgi:hypothetical protein
VKPAIFEADRTRHKGLSTSDYLATLTQIRHELAMELKLRIGEQVQIPGCCDTFADPGTSRHYSGEYLFHGARKASG